MGCPICDWMDEDKLVIYQDKHVVVFLNSEPTVEGHVLVVPRQHYAIMEQVPTDVFEYMFVVANRVSALIFELLGAQGSNILVNNGISAGQDIAHFYINIIPRKENDGLNFRWPPLQIAQDDMESIVAKVKDKCDYIGHEKPKAAPVEVGKVEDVSVDEEDLRLKQLERTP